MMIFEEGQYSGSITSQGFGEGKQKEDGTPGTPFFFVSFMPDAYHDPRIPEPVDCPHIERTIKFYLTDATMEFVSRDLRRLGYDGNTLSDLDPESQDYFSFVGQREKFWLKHEEYKGKIQERWSLAATGIQYTKLDEKKKRHLDAQFGKFLKNTPVQSKAKPVVSAFAPQELQDAALKGDEIPF